MMKSSSHSHRVVVTGMGIVSPIGVGKAENWSNILKGANGIVSVKDVSDLKGLKSQIGGKLPAHFDFSKHQTSVYYPVH